MPWNQLTGTLKGDKGDPGQDAEQIVTRTSDGNAEVTGQSIRVGPTSYPTDIPYANSAYLIVDRTNDVDDGSIVLRTGGNTTGEIGHTGDGNNVNFKVVTGTWGNETFVDSFKMVNPSGYVHVAQRVGIGAEPTTALQVHGGTTVWPVGLTYAATINTDCQLSDQFRIMATGNFTLANPTGMVDGQKVIWEIYADGGADRTVTLGNGFAFGTTITGVTPVKANTADFIGAIYSAWSGRWRVVAYTKGY